MDTLPVQNNAIAPVTAGATVAASAAAGGDSAAAGATAAPASPFGALLALQLVGALPAATKPAPVVDAGADDASAADATATTAADPLAGLLLPGWLPPPATGAAAPNGRDTHAAHTAAGDAAGNGRVTATAVDQHPAAPTTTQTQAADPRAAATAAHAHDEANVHAGDAAERPAAAARSGELVARPADGTANVVAPPPAPPAPAAATQPALVAPVGTPEWNSELGQKIVWMIGDRQQTAELHVNPPELGPLDIKLTIDSQSTTAVFTSPHSAVREAVESALPRLREVLADSGIMLGNASVTADTPRDGRAFAESRPGMRGGDALTADTAAAPVITRITTGVRGLVDLFA